MQTDPIKLQEKTITTVVVVLLMSLCLCAEAASKYGGRQAELGSPVPFSFSLFSFDGGWSSGAERRFTPETFLPPCFGKQKGLFLWGAQWCGRRLWIWAMCQGCCCSVCLFPLPISGACANLQKFMPSLNFWFTSPWRPHAPPASLFTLAMMLVILWKQWCATEGRKTPH